MHGNLLNMMWEHAKYRFSQQPIWSFLNQADIDVPILYGRGKITLLKRRTHSLVFAHRNSTREYESLSSTADSAIECADQDLSICRLR